MAAPPAGRYERLGLAYFRRLADRQGRGAAGRLVSAVPPGHGLAPPSGPVAAEDQALVAGARRSTVSGALIAGLVGAASAAGSVAVELHFEGHAWWVQYGWLAAATLALTALELAVLFWISLRTVYLLARLTGQSALEDDDPQVGQLLPGLLARAALEIPDPVERFLGIDPLARVSRTRLAMLSLAYKLKIATSNVVAKQLLRRLLGRFGLRVAAAWVAVPITAAWNAIVLLKVAREARLRLFGVLIAKQLGRAVVQPATLARLSPRARVGCLQAVGNAVVMAGACHPNLLLLLKRLSEAFAIDGGGPYDDWPAFLETCRAVSPPERAFLLDLLAVAAAFDGRLHAAERRRLGEAFGEHRERYLARCEQLSRLIRQGRLAAARELCRLDFEPG